MEKLTKKQASLLWANDYKIIGRDNISFIITKLENEGMWLKSENNYEVFVKYIRIGVDYFILARPLESLTKEIEHEGEMFVPVVSLGFPNTTEVFESFIHVIDYNYIPSSEKEKLNSWHFDLDFPEGTVKPLK